MSLTTVLQPCLFAWRVAPSLAWFPDDSTRNRATFTARVLQAASRTAAVADGDELDGAAVATTLAPKRPRLDGSDRDSPSPAPTPAVDMDDEDLSLATMPLPTSDVDEAEDRDDDDAGHGHSGDRAALAVEGTDDDDFDAKAFDQHFGLLTENHVVIHAHSETRNSRCGAVISDRQDGPRRLMRGVVAGRVMLCAPASMLYELQPQWIVLYDVDLAFLREVEVYRAQYPERRVQVYVLMYDRSIDEQRYVMAVSKERNAFERLIKERAVRTTPDSTIIGALVLC